MTSKEEIKFLARLKKFPEKILIGSNNAVMEGFEYFTTSEYKKKPGAVKNRGKRMFANKGIKGTIRLVTHMAKIMPSMMINIKKNYSYMEDYLYSLENSKEIPHTSENVIKNFPNKDIWNDLLQYSWSKHKVIVGFTKVSKEYIFEGKAIPFKYALVFAQEMKKEPIEKAPKIDAGMEVQKTYNSLGIATNDIVMWLKDKYNIIGMANHPLGGLVDYVPLAEKAGLGLIGRHAMVITKEFGPRCRISPIFIDEKIFEETDTTEHDWIGEFCKGCGKCVSSCPAEAIYEKPEFAQASHSENTKDRYECYNREKCFVSFTATMGCAVCISVCPFSRNPKLYDKIKTKYR
ncbi:4Fe-4S dicluster domain-containing protein [Alkaliphilus pronyensis]|uniref:4Fe-4S dicluster domain-containing protein n=1 Tax=Alkaliphilus pronyensis TaxID=1482732 RepID=A0A6I0FHE1_9FIRM|nr:4Fe-4S double cluster binding domain-containing protein [Alkaliphilus pronyensis]KAB3538567.1 4Fe-4S dicluster domain-containing protein [Alkaliphilus pronyensis]